MTYQSPCSPKKELDGIIAFPRLCDKIRLQAAGALHPDYHDNVGGGMDLWTCQFLGVSHEDLRQRILNGATDQEVLDWAKTSGTQRTATEQAWWSSYMRNRGFRDELSERLAQRKTESGLENRPDIMTFMDYIDADDALLARNSA